GATVKYIFGKYNAIDAGLDWSTWGTNAVELHADYLINNYTILKNLFNVEGENQFAYIGLGGRIKFADKIIFNNSLNSIGVRLPIGISYIFKDTPIELFLEIAFVLDVSPSTNFNLQGGVGARYYFF
ncbi:MAG: hypothetical protein HQK93_06585, partial [Nitrospirae bacterium]|nr:hypothetical protein [Nitrospirota bacterium]